MLRQALVGITITNNGLLVQRDFTDKSFASNNSKDAGG